MIHGFEYSIGRHLRDLDPYSSMRCKDLRSDPLKHHKINEHQKIMPNFEMEAHIWSKYLLSNILVCRILTFQIWVGQAFNNH